jgi:hypothetical protein
MRMWMVPPRLMCRQHLLGEHLEIHMFLSTIKQHKKIEGYLKNNCLEPRSLKQRHDDLVNEMTTRGYKHKTPIKDIDCACICDLAQEQQYWQINSMQSFEDLLKRCDRCHELYAKYVPEY